MTRALILSSNRECFPEPVFPVGAVYVASALKREGVSVRVFDAGRHGRPLQALRKEIADFRPDVVGLSLRNLDNAAYPATLCYLSEHIELMRAVREMTRAPVFLGGSAFSISPEGLIRLLSADGGATGDGEDGMARLCRGESHRILHGALADLGSVGVTREIAGIFHGFRGYRTIGVQTARGCPFRCVYCTYPLLEGRVVRTRTPEAVADELAFFRRDHGKRDFFFVDSAFNADQTHMARVCEEIVARRLPIRFSCYLEPKMSDASLFGLLARAGCVAADFGIDTGSPAMLLSLGKGFTVGEIRAASLACRKAGIDACHSLILGGPGENSETLRETVRLMDELRPRAVVAMTGIRIYPGTGMESIAREEGVIPPGDDLLYPRFYLAGGDPGWLMRQAKEIASSRRNWFFPGERIWSDAIGPRLLRFFHRNGPLWRTFRPR